MSVLTTLRERENLTGLPLYALGASSGGAFVLRLAAHLQLDSICSHIMALPPVMLQRQLDMGSKQRQLQAAGGYGRIGGRDGRARGYLRRAFSGGDQISEAPQLRLLNALGPHPQMPGNIEVSKAPYPPTMFVHMPVDKRTAGMVAMDMQALESHGVPTTAVEINPRPVTATLLHTKTEELSVSEAEAVVEAFR